MTSETISTALSTKQLFEINQLLDHVSSRQKKDFGNINSYLKDDGTLITDCDKWSDQTIVNTLSEVTPGEGVLSEEGSKTVPITENYWIVDPLDGTTNFAAGIPYWAISMARFVNGQPETAFLEIPALQKRIFAIKGQGVWINDSRISKEHRKNSQSECISLCSRSIRILQKIPDQSFPGKIRLLGVASLNMVSVAIGQTIGALEATPKIWDLASAWLILSELGCPVQWLKEDPSQLQTGQNLSNASFPVLTTNSQEEMKKLQPWADVLIKN